MIKKTCLFISILIGTWLIGCQDDDFTTKTWETDGKTVEITLSTKVPAITIQTRADASEEEKQLKHVDILVFKLDKTGEETKETFAYHTQNANDFSETQSGEEDVYIKTKLKISEEDEEYRLVLIANLKEEIIDFLASDNHEGKIKEELIKEITFIQEKKWPTANEGTEGFRALPMWAESDATTITKTTDANAFGTINFIRSVARIELSVSIADLEDNQTNGSDLIEIQQVTIYNARSKGRAVPDAENIANGKAKAPSLATDGTIEKQYMVYEESIIDNQINNIYVNEARNQQDGKETEDPLFLIIKAIYKGDNPNNTTPTYYKVGFYNGDEKPADVLRNFTYKMVIINVSGPGEDNEEDAVESTSNNLTVALTEWSDGDMKYVVFDGKYYLAVSESEVTVSRSAGKHSFLVKTNHPKGWQAKIGENSEWISNLSPTSSSKLEEKEELFFEVIENEGAERQGKIAITAGNLTLDVHVVQTTEIDYSLQIFINDPDNEGEFIEFDKIITFHSGYHREIKPRKLKMIWTPADSLLSVEQNPYFAWAENVQIAPTYIGGEVEIEIVPSQLSERAPEDWYPEAVGDIQVQIGEESTTKQNILIRRRHHEVYIEKADKYIMDGEPHTFKLYSNTKWEATVSPDQRSYDLINHIHLEKTEGDYNLGDGEDIPFTLEKVDQNISDDIELYVTFWDVDDWVTKSYSIHVYSDDPQDDTRFGEEANCYVLHTGGASVSIPVSQANRFHNENVGTSNFYQTNPIEAGQELKIEFLWTDHPNGYGSQNCPVLSAVLDENNSTGPEARIIVTSGNVQGNAVIAVTNSAGDIHWSWHIWVTDAGFDPYNESSEWPAFRYYEFLDRNLGALSADPTETESKGFYYQWGRKDPFPTAHGGTTTNWNGVYDKNGVTKTWNPLFGDWQNMTNANLLSTTIKNPERFIYSTANATWFSGDWSATATAEFWNEMENGSLSTSKKGIFDPCPEGWKTIPGGAQTNTEWHDLQHLVVYHESGNYSTIESNNIDLGFWPHTGYINGNTAAIINTTQGHYWTGTTNDYAYAFRIRLSGTRLAHMSEALNKTCALPIRCMRRVDTEK